MESTSIVIKETIKNQYSTNKLKKKKNFESLVLKKLY